MQRRTRDRTVVSEHPQLGVVDALAHGLDAEIEPVPVVEPDELGGRRRREPRRLGREEVLGRHAIQPTSWPAFDPRGAPGGVPADRQLPLADGRVRDPRGGVARLPQRDASAPAGQEPAAVHPVEPPMQVLQGAVRPSRCADPAALRLRALAEEPEDLRAVLQGAAGERLDVPRRSRRVRGARRGGRAVDALRRRAGLQQARAADVDVRVHPADGPLLPDLEPGARRPRRDRREVRRRRGRRPLPPVHDRARSCDASGRGRPGAVRGGRLRIGRGALGAAGCRRPHGHGLRRGRRREGRA